MKLRGELF